MSWRVPLLLLLLLLLSITLVLGEQKLISPSPFCKNGTLIPGAANMNAGFDARTSQYLGLPIWKFDAARFSFYSPPGDPTCVYQVPRELGLVPLAESMEKVVQSISASYQEFLQLYASYFVFAGGISIGPFAAGFEYSKELIDAYYHLSASLSVQGFSEHWWKIYQLTSYPSFMLELDDMFNLAMTKLPRTIETIEDVHKYREVVRAWGTHNPSIVNLGASIKIHEYISQQFVKDYSLHFVVEQMGLIFYLDMFDISAGGFKDRAEIIAKLNITFLQNLNRTIFFSGGAVTLQSNSTLKEWIASIPYLAAPQNLTLRPITEFIENVDPIKAMTWSRFVDDYLKNGKGTIKIPISPRSKKSESNKNNNNEDEDETKNKNTMVGDGHILDAAYFIGHGVDVSNSRTGLLPWFDYHFDMKKIWRPINDSTLYIPDEIEVIPRTQSIWSNLTMVIVNGSHYQEARASFSSSSSWFGETTTISTIHYFEQFYLENRNLSISDLSITFGKVVLPLLPFPKLSPLFSLALDKIVMSKDKMDYNLWREFFMAFGTAVMDSAEIGGRLTSQAWTRNYFNKNRSIEFLLEQSSWSFLGIIGDGEGHVSIDTRITSDYISSTRIEFAYQGGDATTMSGDPSRWKIWARGIPSNMMPIAFTTIRLDEFLNLLGYHNLSMVATKMIDRYLNESRQELNELEKQFKSRQVGSYPYYSVDDDGNKEINSYDEKITDDVANPEMNDKNERSDDKGNNDNDESNNSKGNNDNDKSNNDNGKGNNDNDKSNNDNGKGNNDNDKGNDIDKVLIQRINERMKNPNDSVAIIHQLALESAAEFCPYATLNGFRCPVSSNSFSMVNVDKNEGDEGKGNDVDGNKGDDVDENKAINQLPARIGVGWNFFTQDVGLPIFNLTYGIYKPMKLWHNFAVPDQVIFTESNISWKNVNSTSFTSVYNFASGSEASGNWTSGKATIGSYSITSSLFDIYDKYFSEDTSMTITQERRHLYDLSLDPNVGLNLDSRFQAAIDALPLDYDADVYRLLVRYWGTGMVTAARVGGAAEQVTKIRNCVRNVGIDLKPQYQIDLWSQLYPGDYSIKMLDIFYLDHRQASTSVMIGGDPRLANLPDWFERVKTLENYPALIEILFTSYLSFIKDPVKKSNLYRVIVEDYNLMQQERANQLTAAAKSFTAPKQVYGFAMGNSWAEQYPGPNPGFWLTTTTSWNFPSSSLQATNRNFQGFHGQVFGPTGLCERNEQGLIRAKSVNSTGLDWIYKGWRPTSSIEAPWITSGCSSSYQNWEVADPVWAKYYSAPFQLRVDCCMYCQPAYQTICNKWKCENSLKSCDCLKF